MVHMLFGADTYTNVHVALSLVGILTGQLVVLGWIVGKDNALLTLVFLTTTLATSLTGFGFPFGQILPSHVVGAISLAVLAVTFYALYGAGLRDRWRAIYVSTATLALYLNVFVLVVQLFLKVPALNELAPQQTEPPFLLAQGLTLAAYLVLGALAVRGYRPAQSLSPV
jgi:hypothetical protein